MENPKVPSFAGWLGGVVQQHELAVDAGPRDRVRTWSERLAFAMEEGGEYDSYLRRVVNGKVAAPGPSVTYRIGRGLRRAKLSWCSGALALLRSPHAFRSLLALIDIASANKDVHARCVDWFYVTDITEAVELRTYGSGDEEYATAVLQLLADITDRIEPAIEVAFGRFAKRGLANADGLLGIAYRVACDKHSGPRANDARDILVKGWLDEIPSGAQALEFVELYARHSQKFAKSKED